MLVPLTAADGDTILPLEDARVQLNLTADDTFHDAAVTAARDAAINWVENYTGQSLQERQFLWTTSVFACVMRLPMVPVTAVDEISYYDATGVDVSLDASAWFETTNNVAAAFGTRWPYAYGHDGIRITFTAGYATADDIPPFLIAAVKLAMAAMFENRSNPDLSAAMRCADMFRVSIL
jgi:uncharacterized phiE125 gp8 family phage protein